MSRSTAALSDKPRPLPGPQPIGPAIDQALDEAARRWLARMLSDQAEAASSGGVPPPRGTSEPAPLPSGRA